MHALRVVTMRGESKDFYYCDFTTCVLNFHCTVNNYFSYFRANYYGTSYDDMKRSESSSKREAVLIVG